MQYTVEADAKLTLSEKGPAGGFCGISQKLSPSAPSANALHICTVVHEVAEEKAHGANTGAFLRWGRS
jgi:hypothetical protein